MFQFSHLKNGVGNDDTYLTELLQGLNKLICTKCLEHYLTCDKHAIHICIKQQNIISCKTWYYNEFLAIEPSLRSSKIIEKLGLNLSFWVNSLSYLHIWSFCQHIWILLCFCICCSHDVDTSAYLIDLRILLQAPRPKSLSNYLKFPLQIPGLVLSKMITTRHMLLSTWNVTNPNWDALEVWNSCWILKLSEKEGNYVINDFFFMLG